MQSYIKTLNFYIKLFQNLKLNNNKEEEDIDCSEYNEVIENTLSNFKNEKQSCLLELFKNNFAFSDLYLELIKTLSSNNNNEKEETIKLYFDELIEKKLQTLNTLKILKQSYLSDLTKLKSAENANEVNININNKQSKIKFKIKRKGTNVTK